MKDAAGTFVDACVLSGPHWQQEPDISVLMQERDPAAANDAANLWLQRIRLAPCESMRL